MSTIDIVIQPRMRDLGGFSVGRVLPFAKRRMVGPFIFFDLIGPAQFAPGQGIDVRPHPHIGLATVTYLFDGEIRHKDSLGYDQLIHPGDVNWMVAGRGIAHSERTAPNTRAAGQKMHGIQSWVALPEDQAEIEPAFFHHPKETLPEFNVEGVTMSLIAGEAYGRESPVNTHSPLFYLAADMPVGAVFEMPADYDERALFIVDGELSVDGETYKSGDMVVFKNDVSPALNVRTAGRAMLLGGAPLGPRKIWWNYVASSDERIEKAKHDWTASAAAGFNGTPFTLPPGETEHIPLPDA